MSARAFRSWRAKSCNDLLARAVLAMLAAASDLLAAFIAQEVEQLKGIDMPHMPTLAAHTTPSRRREAQGIHTAFMSIIRMK